MGRRREDHDVDAAVDHFLVGVEPGKNVVVVDRHLFRYWASHV